MEGVSNTAEYFDSLGLSTKPKAAKEQSEQDQFLQLMLAQLKNQDPFQPMENGEFLTQLAQFNSAAGIKDLQKSFQSVASSLQSNQALQASSMVGRSVLVPGENAVLNSSGMQGSVDVPADADRVVINITDMDGQLLRRVDIGPQAEGLVNYVWDGVDAQGDQHGFGTYKVRAEIWNGTNSEAGQTYAKASVGSVTIGQGGQGLTLNLDGLGSVSMSDVKQIS